jgi:hypothetical protein
MTTACLHTTFRGAGFSLRCLGNARTADRAYPRWPQPARRTVVFGTPDPEDLQADADANSRFATVKTR